MTAAAWLKVIMFISESLVFGTVLPPEYVAIRCSSYNPRLWKKTTDADTKSIVEMLGNASPEINAIRRDLTVQCVYLAVRDETE